MSVVGMPAFVTPRGSLFLLRSQSWARASASATSVCSARNWVSCCLSSVPFSACRSTSQVTRRGVRDWDAGAATTGSRWRRPCRHRARPRRADFSRSLPWLPSFGTTPRQPIPGLLCGLAAGKRDTVLRRYLGIIGIPWPVIHAAAAMANAHASRDGVAETTGAVGRAGSRAPLPPCQGVRGCLGPQPALGGPRRGGARRAWWPGLSADSGRGSPAGNSLASA